MKSPDQILSEAHAYVRRATGGKADRLYLLRPRRESADCRGRLHRRLHHRMAGTRSHRVRCFSIGTILRRVLGRLRQEGRPRQVHTPVAKANKKGKARLPPVRPLLCPGSARQAVPQEPRNIPP